MAGVSVVIPAFNRAHLLEPTVRSVLAQTVEPLEVLIVDDGSTDDTAAVCARFRAPVRCIRQENRGLPGARNTGIREARGEWIALCDSDDLWRPRKLEVQLAAMARTGAEWSISGCGVIDPDGRPIVTPLLGFPRVFATFRETGATPEAHFGRWLRRDEVKVCEREIPVYAGDAYGLFFEGNVALPSSAILSRALVDRVGPFDEAMRVAEETEYFHRVAALAPVAVVLDRLVDYRVGHGSIVSSGGPERLIVPALESLERAVRLRPEMTPGERRAYHAGRTRLLQRLAYARLSSLDGAGARAALREGGTWSARAALILLASLFPPGLLARLHETKRAFRRAVEPA